MEVALIFPVVAFVIAALAVAYGRWGPGKLGNHDFDARRREAGSPDRPYWMGPGSGPGSTGLGDMDGGGL